MKQAFDIEPVGPERYGEAIRFVVSGGRSDDQTAWRAERLLALVAQPGVERARVWWARRGGGAVAAVVLLTRPGRTGMLFRCRPEAPGVDASALSAVVRQACAAGLEGGLTMVQAFAGPDDRADLAVLRDGGMRRVAELVYLRLDLSERPGAGASLPAGWRVRSFEEFETGELYDVVESTYVDSLDCPPVSGLRPIEDVVDSHKTSGHFRPQSWWLADREGVGGGCVLVNGCGGQANEAELVYLGVCPPFRGQGLGRLLLRWAADRLAAEGIIAIRLAVDTANHYAIKLYREDGFVELERSVVMASLRSREEEAAKGGPVKEL